MENIAVIQNQYVVITVNIFLNVLSVGMGSHKTYFVKLRNGQNGVLVYSTFVRNMVYQNLKKK